MRDYDRTIPNYKRDSYVNYSGFLDKSDIDSSSHEGLKLIKHDLHWAVCCFP